MKIIFDAHRPIRIHDTTMYAWFPQLADSQSVDGFWLAESLQSRIQGRYGISSYDISETLRELFIRLGRNPGFGEDRTQMSILQTLLQELKRDVKTAWHTKGLQGSRHAFVILAYLASEHESVLLAQALLQFWQHGGHHIQKESRRYLPDWQKALQKIQEVLQGPTTMDIEPLAMMPYVLPHHGRSRRALALPWHGHRARSLPAMRRRRSPDMRLAIPTYPSSGWTSPVMSPVGYPRGDYFEELDNLQNQQSEMSYQLNNVDQKLDLLLAGGYY
jgi:hypothetical protein